jgi:hypothetical protein
MKSRHFAPGTPVRHPTHGEGEIVGEWGLIDVISEGKGNKGGRMKASCRGVYDCVFGAGGGRHLHSCRAEFLERI